MVRLSVIVPVYNVEKYLKKCVDSIVQQLNDDDEVILVDDGSKDNSGIIADEYAAHNAAVKVIHQKNQGLSAARNAGIDAAKGKWLAFVDSDDYVEPTMYQELMELAQKENAQIAKGGVWYEQETGERYSPYPEGVVKSWNTKEALIELNSYRYFNMSFCDGVFCRSLFEKGEEYDEELRFPVGKLCEDYYLMHQVIARANKVAYTSKPYYHYIQRSNSISRNKKINMAPMDASMQQLSFFQQNFPDLTYVAETACAFSYMGIYTAHVRQDVPCPKKLLHELKKVSRKYLPSVLKNNNIPKIKKMQAITFCYALPIYRQIIGRTKHR